VTTRLVLYGEYPPFSTPGAAATLATVRSLLAEGREITEIEVVSPRPSAAHHHAEAGDPKGAAKLARLVAGADFVAHLDPGILGESSALGPAAARAAFGIAVRRARSATIYLSPLTARPTRTWVRSILGAADRVVVASAEDARTLRAAGLDDRKLSVAEEAWWLAADAGTPSPHESWSVPAGASREDIEAEVRLRAARQRLRG
jgi:hypothetical protein